MFMLASDSDDEPFSMYCTKLYESVADMWVLYVTDTDLWSILSTQGARVLGY